MTPGSTTLKLAAVFVGAGIGGVLRYLFTGFVQHWFRAAAPAWASFPVGTIAVNLTGCFAIGLLATLLTEPLPVREEIRLLLLVGLLGGYTTFSAFGRETMTLMQQGDWIFAALNVLVSNVAGIAAVFAGAWLAQRLSGSVAP